MSAEPARCLGGSPAKRAALINESWTAAVTRLGGPAAIDMLARETKAFQRPREIKSAVDLLRIILAYCLSGLGLRATSAWAAAIGLADLSNVALLGRLRNSTAWLERLVAGLLVGNAAGLVTHGRRVRLFDGTTVPKASLEARSAGGCWRVHAGLELPSERFSFFEVSDEKGAEHLGRAALGPGEIGIWDRGYMGTERLADACRSGADLIVRSGWRRVRWLDDKGEKLDIIALLGAAADSGRIDCPIHIGRDKAAPMPLRLVAWRKPPLEREAARLTARREAKKEKAKIAPQTLVAAEWVLLVTTLGPQFTAEEIGALYRARWRIELAFKRLKSIIGLDGPPGNNPEVAKTWVLAHLLMVLLLEPHLCAPEVSPRRAPARLAA